MLFKACALLALIAFAHVAHAQDDDMGEEVKDKQDGEDDMGLESRYGGGSRGRYSKRGGGGYKGNGLNNLELEEGGLGGLRGGRGRGNRGNLEGFQVDIANQVETNKVVPGIVEVAPTVVTNSDSTQVVSSVRRRNFKQNSESKVVQNNVVKSTDIHVHTNRKVKIPKTINTYVRKHHTQYIINTQPVKTNINIERVQEIIKPEVENVVVYQNTESLSRHRRPTIVRNRQQHQRLPTIRERTRNEGTEVIGNPLNAGSASLGRGENGSNRGGLELNIEYEGSRGGYKSGKSRSSSYGL